MRGDPNYVLIDGAVNPAPLALVAALVAAVELL